MHFAALRGRSGAAGETPAGPTATPGRNSAAQRRAGIQGSVVTRRTQAVTWVSSDTR